MTDDGIVRQGVREAIGQRRLPARPPDRTWGGMGTGGPCAIRGASVKADEAELELEFSGNPHATAETYRVHARCFAIREVERLRQMNAGSVPTGGSLRTQPRRSGGAATVRAFSPDRADVDTTAGRESGRPCKPRSV
jgi:hypothetical protein